MSSIFGAIGDIDKNIINSLKESSKQHSQSECGERSYKLSNGLEVYLGSWITYASTDEIKPNQQPCKGIVFNGVIANDLELGNTDNDPDYTILPDILNSDSISSLKKGIKLIKGSYAMAIASNDTLYLAANYRPIYYARINGAVYFASKESYFDKVLNGVKPIRLGAYKLLNVISGELISLLDDKEKKALVIASAGLDSTTVAYKLRGDGYKVDLLHFNYGCKAESRELNLIQKISIHLGSKLYLLSIDYSQFNGKSSLFGDNEITKGATGAEYAHEWVASRNLLMLSHAVAFAESNGYTHIALGNNLEESGAYPDNEEEFTFLLNQAVEYAVADGCAVEILSPVGGLMKSEIVELGLSIGVPYHLTWSCYHNGENHCGQCAPCFMRKTAFERNGRKDPVMNLDN